MPDLLYHLVRPDPRAEAAIEFVLANLGITARAAVPPELWGQPHLVYGTAEPHQNGFAIAERPSTPFWGALLSGEVDPEATEGRIEFDIVAAIATLLGDDLHADVGPDALDDHGRLTYRASLPTQAGLGDRPIVNEYVAFVGAALKARLGVEGSPSWPNGRRAAIGLSHDVDTPDRYALLGSALRPWRFRRSPLSYVRGGLTMAVARSHDRDPDDFWLFDRVTESERAFGFRSTFFFATVPFHASRGSHVDVTYNVSEKRYRRVLRALSADGFEVGLHASYRAHERAEWMAAERARLSSIAGQPISGVRHHYWHLGPDVAATLRSHEDAGFTYDSSIAFNDHIGFRRSVALPFNAFDAGLGRTLRTIELPTVAMDGSLFSASNDIDSAVAAVDTLVDRIADVGGFGAVDWHIQASYPANPEYRVWGLTYLEILRFLAARSDVWVDSLGAIARWVSRRNSRLAATARAPSDGPNRPATLTRVPEIESTR
ncbi:MAG: polysaccharide deacetylase family protein [Candidatus Limnocylindrales bacterium]